MADMSIIGRVNSIQTLGTLDGPGVRFVLFLQGCPLRCACCHNPETWDALSGTEMTADEVVGKVCKYKEYFGEQGGITISGGEPLLQWEFVYSVFQGCKDEGISTCLDTSGCLINDNIQKVLDFTDTVLLDIKYTDEKKYNSYVGCSAEKPLEFLQELEKRNIDTWVRQVVIPGINDDKNNFDILSRIINAHSCIKKCELLAFRKLCISKYEEMNIEFPFSHIDETTPEKIIECQSYVDSLITE